MFRTSAVLDDQDGHQFMKQPHTVVTDKLTIGSCLDAPSADRVAPGRRPGDRVTRSVGVEP
jgi:hypothetical protein